MTDMLLKAGLLYWLLVVVCSIDIEHERDVIRKGEGKREREGKVLLFACLHYPDCCEGEDKCAWACPPCRKTTKKPRTVKKPKDDKEGDDVKESEEDSEEAVDEEEEVGGVFGGSIFDDEDLSSDIADIEYEYDYDYDEDTYGDYEGERRRAFKIILRRKRIKGILARKIRTKRKKSNQTKLTQSEKEKQDDIKKTPKDKIRTMPKKTNQTLHKQDEKTKPKVINKTPKDKIMSSDTLERRDRKTTGESKLENIPIPAPYKKYSETSNQNYKYKSIKHKNQEYHIPQIQRVKQKNYYNNQPKKVTTINRRTHDPYTFTNLEREYLFGDTKMHSKPNKKTTDPVGKLIQQIGSWFDLH